MLNFEILKNHIGHNLEVAKYGKGKQIENVAIECVDCNEVLISYEYEDDEKMQELFDYHLQKGQGFVEFLDSSFRSTSQEASLEELAEWTFGSIGECLEAWKNK